MIMKNISDYANYCTEEQTKRAFELGAFLREVFYSVQSPETAKQYHLIIINDKMYEIPTTEQMIGWLGDKRIQVSIIYSYRVSPLRWNYDLDNDNIILFEHNSVGYSSCKEATLAAIDASLDYLENKKIV